MKKETKCLHLLRETSTLTIRKDIDISREGKNVSEDTEINVSSTKCAECGKYLNINWVEWEPETDPPSMS